MYDLKRVSLVLCCLWTALASPLHAAENSVSGGNANETNIVFDQPKPTLWESEVGEGFRKTVQTFSVQAGAVQGIDVLGGLQCHDLTLLSLSYGHMLSHTVGQGHFYQGNWELRGEVFGGSEFAPKVEWVFGLTPHLRYNFATGTRFVPFVDAGAGVTATSISPPDLSNVFEFNLQATLGTHWFIRDDLALTVEARYLHMSCAGISDPNRGLNAVGGMLGLTFLF